MQSRRSPIDGFRKKNFVEQSALNAQIREALSKLEEVATQADVRLRTEIGQVTGIIDTAIGKLKAQVDESASTTAASRALPQSTSVAAPSPPPGQACQGKSGSTRFT